MHYTIFNNTDNLQNNNKSLSELAIITQKMLFSNLKRKKSFGISLEYIFEKNNLILKPD